MKTEDRHRPLEDSGAEAMVVARSAADAGLAPNDDGRLRSWVQILTSTALLEFAVLIALALTYNFIRAGQGEDAGAAFEHARDIVAVEGQLFHLVEGTLNGWLVALPMLAVPACYFYAVLHYLATPAVLVRSWRVGGWVHRRAYWSLVLASAIALIAYAKYPVAPPRLVPGLDVVDAMRHFADYGWWGNAASAPRGIGDATNQFAAMPSLHFGWSLWCAIQMWGFGTRAWRVAAVAYPTTQAVVVLATGNHFILDVLAGAACVLVAHVVITLIGRAISMSRQRAGDLEL
jgi:hypothetical protein